MLKKKDKKEDKEKDKKPVDLLDMTKRFEKEFGKSSIMSSNTVLETQFVIPSSSMNLNMLLGCGGAPSGRILELFGPEGGAKTFLSLDFAINCQKMGKNVCFVDAEHALDIFWAKKLGLSESMLTWLSPESGEEAFDMIERAVCSGQYGLIILDSVAELTPTEELEGKLIDVKNRMGLVAKMMSVGLRKLTSCVSKMNTTVIFVNQVRDNIGTIYGNPEVTPGGRALKFYSSIRLRVNKASKFEGKLGYYGSKGDAVKADDIIIGQEINIAVEKNKMAAPVFHKAEFYMHYNTGIDKDKELMSIASTSSIDLAEKVQGKKAYIYKGNEINLENGGKIEPTLFESIKKDILDKVKTNKEETIPTQSTSSIFSDALVKGVIIKDGEKFIFEDNEANSQKEFETLIAEDNVLKSKLLEKIKVAKIEL